MIETNVLEVIQVVLLGLTLGVVIGTQLNKK
jgi:hypothetical protein